MTTLPRKGESYLELCVAATDAARAITSVRNALTLGDARAWGEAPLRRRRPLQSTPLHAQCQAAAVASAMPRPFARTGSRPIGRRTFPAAIGGGCLRKSSLAQSPPDAVDAPFQDERDASEQCARGDHQPLGEGLR